LRCRPDAARPQTNLKIGHTRVFLELRVVNGVVTFISCRLSDGPYKNRYGQTHRVWVREHCVRRQGRARIVIVSVASRVSKRSMAAICSGLCGPTLLFCHRLECASTWERWSGGMKKMTSNQCARLKFCASSVRRFVVSVRPVALRRYCRSIIPSSG
jgi:hypothetical protein